MSSYLIHDEIDRQAEWRPSKTAFRFEDHSYTYSEFAQRTENAAGALQSVGLGLGDVVTVHGANHVDLYTLFFACSRLGCVFTTISTFQTEANVDYIVEQTAPSAVFYTDDEVITDGLLPTLSSAVEDAPAYSLDGTSVDGDRTFSELVEGATPLSRAPKVTAETDHNVFWTSGTTGTPKAAVRTHLDTLNYSRALAEEFPYDAEHTRLIFRDLMFHAPYIRELPGLTHGETYLLHRRFSAEAVVEAFRTEDIDVANPQHAHAKELIDYVRTHDTPARAGYAVTGLRSRSITEGMLEHLYEIVYHIYGSTEIGTICVKPVDPSEELLDPPSLGKPGTGTNVRLVEPVSEGLPNPDRTVDRDEAGELICRGATTFTRYLDEDDQRENVRDGWVYTGDLVRRTGVGDLQFVGRVDNRIRSGGVDVYPESVERVLETHQAVDAAVVVGVDDEQWGDRVCALIVATNPDTDPTALAEKLEQYCIDSTEIARQLRPREYRVVRSLEDVPTGGLAKYDRDAVESLFG